jgi:hypothetical protein
MRSTHLLLLLIPVLVSAPVEAGRTGACQRLCRAERKGCAPARKACLADARTAAREARAACTSPTCRREARAVAQDAIGTCRAVARRCRRVPIADCRRALGEPVVPENALGGCPVTPLTACSELGPEEQCRDALHPADAFFWDRLHAGDYGAIPEMLDRLEAALAERPDDPSLERHVAWSHVWRLGELARGTASGADIADSIAQLRPGFTLARQLNPGDPRVLGFLAAVTLNEGILSGDASRYAEGTGLFAEGIAAWPEFNYFSSGYILSQLPSESAGFQLGLEQQWRNIDVCAGSVVDRHEPDLVATFARETRVGRQRACWNSWIAPFNVEGFFLNLGDMLVKDGQVATGVRVYQAAQQVGGYERWPYRGALERRIVEAAENATRFNQSPGVTGTPIMLASSYSCMGCHQAR